MHDRRQRTPVIETDCGYSGDQAAPAVRLTTTHANRFVPAGAEKCWSRFDNCGGQMHDVFTVISETWGGEQIARTVYAASEDDARQTHHENYADDTIVAVHQ